MKNLIHFILLLSSIFTVKVATASNEAMMDISAIVDPVCTIVASNLDFGVYNSSISNNMAILSVRCTNGSTFKIRLSKGDSPSKGMLSNNSQSGTQLLKYELYQDPTMQKIWGDDDSTTFVGQADGREHNYIIYGQIPDNQNLPQGVYTSDLLISLRVSNTNTTIAYQTVTVAKVTATIDDKLSKN
ncbi:MAG: Csu type fimbrial protein [Janthinobacterium lividum]